MTVQFIDTDGHLLRSLQDCPIPRQKERVEIKNKVFVVNQVVTVIQSDFTTVPTIIVQLRRA